MKELKATLLVENLHSLWSEGFPGGSDGKESVCHVGDSGWIPGSEQFPGEGSGDPLQYSCLGNPMDQGAWWAMGVTKIWTQLSE